MSRNKLNLANTALLGRATTRAVSLFAIDESRSLREIDIDKITANPLQPRRHFDEQALALLAASIERHGLLQPICVREETADRYQIIAGERRWRAFVALGRPTIPALVTRTDDPSTLALIENIQREDLDALELAEALGVLLSERGVSHEQLGLLIGKSQAYVTRMLGILSLPRQVREEYAAHRQVPTSALMIIAEAGDVATQLALWEQAKAGLSVRGLLAARKAQEDDGTHTAAATRAGARTAAAQPAAARALKSLRKGTEALRSLRQEGAALSEDHTAALQALRDEIDALLAQSAAGL